jgi:multiple sugar transport system permease protein
MKTATLSRPQGVDLERWLARRRVSRMAILYVILLVLTILMMGPFIYTLSLSVNPKPTQYPPILIPHTLKPGNLVAAFKLGGEASGNGLMGGWAPGHTVTLEARFLSSKPPTAPRVTVLANLGSTAVSTLASVTPPEVTSAGKPVLVSQAPAKDGQTLYTYHIAFKQTGDQKVSALPVNLSVPISMHYEGGTIQPTDIQNRFVAYSLDYASLAGGVIPYLFGNYRDAITTFKLPGGAPAFIRWIFNSLLLAVVRVFTNVLFGSMAGFALARLEFRGKWLIFYFFVIFSQMLPAQVLMPSNYLVIKNGVFGLFPNLLNTYWAVILPTLVGGSAAFVMKQFLESIPKEVEEAARIDGASVWTIYWRIIMPMAKPALIAMTVLYFQGAWNDFFWPFVVYTHQNMYTLPIGLTFFKNFYASGTSAWGPVLGGAIISALPVVLIFFFFQRYFVEGFSFSSVKG